MGYILFFPFVSSIFQEDSHESKTGSIHVENRNQKTNSYCLVGDSGLSCYNLHCHCFLLRSHSYFPSAVPQWPLSFSCPVSSCTPACHRISESSISGSCRCNTQGLDLSPPFLTSTRLCRPRWSCGGSTASANSSRFEMAGAQQRTRVANEKATKNITQRGNVTAKPVHTTTAYVGQLGFGCD